MTKSDLKAGYLVKLEDGTLCKIEPFKNGIGLFGENGTWYATILNPNESGVGGYYNDELVNKEDYDLTINEVYGYAECNFANFYDVSNRELLWKREEDKNLKEYKINCSYDDFIKLSPNYDDGYLSKDRDIIYMELKTELKTRNSLCEDVGLSLKSAKELIWSLQEIVDYVEGEEQR